MKRMAAALVTVALLAGCKSIEDRTETRSRDAAVEGWVRDAVGQLWQFALKLTEAERIQGHREVEIKPPAFVSSAAGILSLIPGGAGGLLGGLGTVGSLALAWWQTRQKRLDAEAAREIATTSDEIERAGDIAETEKVKAAAMARQERKGIRTRVQRLRGKGV